MSRAASERSENWTTRRLLAWMTEAFTRAGLDSPRLCAELLVSHVIGAERLRLYTDPDRPASPLERDALRDLVSRALKHEPVQYLVGQAWFFGLPFRVDRRVLIPRPSTETIVEELLQHARAEPGWGVAGGASGTGLLIADLCTGSGCLAVAILKNLAGARAVATDLSYDAIEIAVENARRHAVFDRIEFQQGNLLEPLRTHAAAGSFHAIMSNPPYIPDHEWDEVAPNVRLHEPHLALRAGTEGLDFIAPILAGAPDLLRPGGMLLVETAACHAARAAELARDAGLTAVRTVRDLDNRPRVLIGFRSQ
ncbi:MAG: peptide chain release factor N(5)-glutamine methyltransferase [Phycisphaerae bacterium]|nr:peptide chain release factor N(5)-glutamine methyltransferase [Phycisphaerae bacterium]